MNKLLKPPRFLLAVIIALGSITCYSQQSSPQVVNVTGGTISNSQYSIDYSVGEISTITLLASNNSTTGGFIQPVVTTTVTAVIPISNSSVQVYPNPTSGVIIIKGLGGGLVRAELISIIGTTLEQMVSESSIDLSDVDSGVYLLKIYDSNNTTQTFKIIKQ